MHGQKYIKLDNTKCSDINSIEYFSLYLKTQQKI